MRPPIRHAPFLLEQGSKLSKARMYHALKEAGLHPRLWAADKDMMMPLDRIVSLDTGPGMRINGIGIDHRIPAVRVGRVSRPYLFPEALVNLCRRCWAAQRTIPVSFRGLVTPKRERALARWRQQESVQISATERGRSPELKWWDVDYFQELGRSKYVLSPDGEWPFTYRTFEAALCGAVPIVQTQHDCYGPLHVLQMDQVNVEDLPEWSEELAKENAKKASALVTIPPDELRAEVYRLGGY